MRVCSSCRGANRYSIKSPLHGVYRVFFILLQDERTTAFLADFDIVIVIPAEECVSRLFGCYHFASQTHQIFGRNLNRIAFRRSRGSVELNGKTFAVARHIEVDRLPQG